MRELSEQSARRAPEMQNIRPDQPLIEHPRLADALDLVQRVREWLTLYPAAFEQDDLQAAPL
jgi:hypothetical protein